MPVIEDEHSKWPSAEAERVELFLRKAGDPFQEKSLTGQRKCVFRLNEKSDLLNVVLKDEVEESVVDIIDPKDIIGVNVEIKLIALYSDEEVDKITSIALRNSGNDTPSGLRKEAPCSPAEVGQAADNEPSSEILTDNQANAILSIFVYPKRKTRLKGSIFRFCGTDRDDSKPSRAGVTFMEEIDREQDSPGHRYAHHRQFTVAPTEDFTDLSILVNAIRKLSRQIPTTNSEVPLRDEEERLLVIVNPYSGKKAGVNEYETMLFPILEQAGISHDCLITTHSRHAEERMNKQSSKSDFKDISEYSGIVLVGGDGIIHEVMQGIHRRSDRDEILKKIKLGTIGAGTSNGFSASLAHASKENISPLDSAFMIAKGMSAWVDLSRYETKSKSYTSFLTFSWAMIADIDIESECIRWAGFLRMDIWGVVRVLFLRKYRARFSYLPPTEEKKAVKIPPLDQPLAGSEGWITCEDEFIVFWVSQVTHAGEQMFHAPPCKLNDGVFHIMIVRGNVSRVRLAMILLSMEHGGHYGMNGVEFVKCSAYRLEPLTQGSFNNLDGEVIEPGPVQAAALPSSIRAYCAPKYS
mmetsp:Transcript_10205/g.29957  ORF Transcript_10205/g.29957 Transcript_10205/m.29957 type:complete len:580 (-) Transcript_10205:106-1845(-)